VYACAYTHTQIQFLPRRGIDRKGVGRRGRGEREERSYQKEEMTIVIELTNLRFWQCSI